MDRTLAGAILFFLIPLFLVLMLLISLVFNTNPLFFQGRLGYKGKVFNVIKFKTMRDIRDSNGNLLPDNLRLTFFGRLLRALSLDELPQLFNIIKGDMSFIGPRPFIKDYRDLYTKNEMRRHSVKPGITGWAQVNGRNSVTWKEKFAYDLHYVDNASFLLDLNIIIKTFRVLIKTKLVNQNQGTTMEKYNGSN